MNKTSENSYRLFWMLGLSLTLPMILLSGPLAGYFISFLLIERFDWPGYLRPILISSGLLVSGIQAYRLISKLKQIQNNQTEVRPKS